MSKTEPGVVNGVLRNPREYFFHILNRIEGSGANDHVTVLKQLQNRGMLINPKPSQRPTKDMPFHGITLMVGGNGDPRGRIWLPTKESNTDSQGNEWFTREVQVIADGPGGFVWKWQELGGAPFVPINEGEEGEEVTPPTGNTELEKRIEVLEKRIKELEDKKTTRKVALRSKANGKVVCVELDHDGRLIANREQIQGWEELELIYLD